MTRFRCLGVSLITANTKAVLNDNLEIHFRNTKQPLCVEDKQM